MSEEVADESVAVVPGLPWELLLPPGWWTIPTRTDQARASIVALLDRTFEGTPRDELIGLRVEMDRALTDSVRRAAEQGSTHLHTLAEPIHGVPVNATLVVTPVSIGPSGSVAEAFAHVLDSGGGVLEHGRVQVGGRPALRRVRRSPVELDLDGTAVSRWQTAVDYVVDVGPDDLLLLSFSTTTDQVRAAMVVVFDAMAATLRQRT